MGIFKIDINPIKLEDSKKREVAKWAKHFSKVIRQHKSKREKEKYQFIRDMFLHIFKLDEEDLKNVKI